MEKVKDRQINFLKGLEYVYKVYLLIFAVGFLIENIIREDIIIESDLFRQNDRQLFIPSSIH